MKGLRSAAFAAVLLCSLPLLAACKTDNVAMPTRDQVNLALNVAGVSLQAAEGVYQGRRAALPAAKIAKLDRIFKDADAALAAANATAALTDDTATIATKAAAVSKLIADALDVLDQT